LVCLLENRGILFVELEDVDDHFSGVNGFVNGRPYVAVNASMSPERNRSTIVHEIAHLMFDWGDIVDKEQEDHATAIGGAFLLPADDAVRELGVRRRAITRDMEMVAREYGVSMMLLSKRASLAGIINDSAYRSFCIIASHAGWRKDEPSRIDPERSELFKQLVYRAVCEDDMSVQRGAELLGLSFDQVAYECDLCGT
jgi:Zn-dependent peptidase ImmA (M78 family)